MRSQIRNNIDNTVSLYIQEADKNFFKISRRIILLLLGNQNNTHEVISFLNIVEENKSPLKVKVAIQQLRERFLEYSWEYGEDFKFFTYFREQKSFLKLSYINKESLNEDKDIEHELVHIIESGKAEIYSAKKQWDVFTAGNNQYLVKIMKSNNKYLGCYIKVENLLGIFKELEVSNGIYFLVNNNDKVVSYYNSSNEDNNSNVAEQISFDTKGIFKNIIFNKSFSRIPYKIRIIVDNYSVFQGALIIQILIILASLFVLFMQTSIMFFVTNHILKPVKKFTTNLMKYE